MPFIKTWLATLKPGERDEKVQARRHELELDSQSIGMKATRNLNRSRILRGTIKRSGNPLEEVLR